MASRIQLRLRVLGHLFHLVIDNAKNLDDNVFGGHKDSSCARVVWLSLLNTIFVTSQISSGFQLAPLVNISFWLGEGIRPEPLHDAMTQQLTPESRLTIFRIKDVRYQLPVYRVEVASSDIYDAVLQHGGRTLAEFDQYLVERGKPPRAQSR